MENLAQACPSIQLLHRIKSILCYEEEGPVFYECDGPKIQQNHYFVEQIQNFRNPKMPFDGLDVNLQHTLNSVP